MSTKKKNKKKKVKQNKAKPAKNKAKEIKFDKFNRRLGTQGALIDEKMSKIPKSIEQLSKECKLPKGRIATHLRDLTKKGFFKRTKDGYAIK